MKLFAVLLGGSGGPGRLSEDHETVFVVAEDERSAKTQARKKWTGHGRPHVDALSSVESVDGYDITVNSGGSASEREFVSSTICPTTKRTKASRARLAHRRRACSSRVLS